MKTLLFVLLVGFHAEAQAYDTNQRVEPALGACCHLDMEPIPAVSGPAAEAGCVYICDGMCTNLDVSLIGIAGTITLDCPEPTQPRGRHNWAPVHRPGSTSGRIIPAGD